MTAQFAIPLAPPPAPPSTVPVPSVGDILLRHQPFQQQRQQQRQQTPRQCLRVYLATLSPAIPPSLPPSLLPLHLFANLPTLRATPAWRPAAWMTRSGVQRASRDVAGSAPRDSVGDSERLSWRMKTDAIKDSSGKPWSARKRGKGMKNLLCAVLAVCSFPLLLLSGCKLLSNRIGRCAWKSANRGWLHDANGRRSHRLSTTTCPISCNTTATPCSDHSTNAHSRGESARPSEGAWPSSTWPVPAPAVRRRSRRPPLRCPRRRCSVARQQARRRTSRR